MQDDLDLGGVNLGNKTHTQGFIRLEVIRATRQKCQEELIISLRRYIVSGLCRSPRLAPGSAEVRKLSQPESHLGASQAILCSSYGLLSPS